MAVDVGSVGDLATMGLAIDSNGALIAIKDLDKLAETGEKTEQRLKQSSAKSSQAMNTQAASVQRLGSNQGKTAISASRMGNAFQTLTVQALGANRALFSVASLLGTFALGGGIMAAVLGGLAAVAFAWNRIGRAARDAKKDQDDAIASLLKMKSIEQAGPGGETALNTEAARAARTRQENQASKFETAAGQSRERGDFMAARFFDWRAQRIRDALAKTAEAITTGEAAVSRATVEAATEQEQIYRRQLANLVATNQATARERADALALLQDYQQRIKTTTDQSLRSEFASGIEELSSALFPNAQKAAREAANEIKRFREEIERSNEAILESALENIATSQEKIDALRVEVDQQRRMNAAMVEGQHAVDALTIAMAGENAARDLEGKAMPRAIQQARELAEEKARLSIAERQIADAMEKQREEREEKERKDAERKRDEEKYADDMRAIWRQGIGKIVTDGTKSFRDFFENVLKMFSQLMRRMEQEGKDSGALYGMLKIGGAAIGGGLAGYEVGSRTTSGVRGAGMGALSGAATGYAMGGPVGAAVGAVTGFIGGIIGSGKAAREAAREMAALQKALAATMKVLRAQVAGDDLAVTIAQIQAQTDALKKQASEAYKGRANEAERFRIQREAEALGAKLIEQAREEHALKLQQFTQDLRVRELRSQGRSIAAQELAFALTQERELADARKSGATAAQLATLATVHAAEAQQRAADMAREQQRALDDLNFRLAVANGMTEDQASELAAATAAQREYEDAVRAGRDETYLSTLQQVHLAEAHKRSADKIRATIAQLEQTIGTLSGFRDSLLLSSVSNLSPTGQLAEARRQYEEILAMAKGGDQGAAGRLPGAAQTLLDFSRQVNATGGMFTVDFNKVLSDTQGLIDLFSTQKSVAERQLEELVRIRDEAQRIGDNTIPEPRDTRPSIPWPPPEIPWTPPPGGIPDSPEQRRRHEEELAALQMVRDEIAALVRVQASGNQQLIHGVDTVRTAVEDNTTVTRRSLEGVAL